MVNKNNAAAKEKSDWLLQFQYVLYVFVCVFVFYVTYVNLASNKGDLLLYI